MRTKFLAGDRRKSEFTVDPPAELCSPSSRRKAELQHAAYIVITEIKTQFHTDTEHGIEHQVAFVHFSLMIEHD